MSSFYLRVWKQSTPDDVREIKLEPGTTTLGRERDNRVHVDDDGASRHHAQLLINPGGEVALVDNQSTNGTWMHGERITRCTLNAGDRFSIGETQFELARSSFSASTVAKAGAGKPAPERVETPVTTQPAFADGPPPRPPSPRRLSWRFAGDPAAPWNDVLIATIPFKIGRDTSNHLSFAEETTVSRFHAVIEESPDGLLIVDKGSSNGVYVNDAKVDRYTLEPDDRIVLGRVEMVFERAAAMARATASPSVPIERAGVFKRPGEKSIAPQEQDGVPPWQAAHQAPPPPPSRPVRTVPPPPPPSSPAVSSPVSRSARPPQAPPPPPPASAQQWAEQRDGSGAPPSYARSSGGGSIAPVSLPEAGPRDVTCPSCGARLPSDAQFCGQCGGSLQQAPAAVGLPSVRREPVWRTGLAVLCVVGLAAYSVLALYLFQGPRLADPGFVALAVAIPCALAWIYFALVLMALAERTATPNGWLGWLPVLNVYLTLRIAALSGWWLLAFFVPLLNFVVWIWAWMRISRRLGRSRWLGLWPLVPLIGMVAPLYLVMVGQPVTIARGTRTCASCGEIVEPGVQYCGNCGQVQ
ncbi:MAG: FHA domain-containing protein [Acidobacteriota bacterium]